MDAVGVSSLRRLRINQMPEVLVHVFSEKRYEWCLQTNKQHNAIQYIHQHQQLHHSCSLFTMTSRGLHCITEDMDPMAPKKMDTKVRGTLDVGG